VITLFAKGEVAALVGQDSGREAPHSGPEDQDADEYHEDLNLKQARRNEEKASKDDEHADDGKSELDRLA
jgi:hypothetical protein